MRVRENAESIAFYGGEASEERLLFERLAAAVANYGQLLLASRNLQFFTSFYRHVETPSVYIWVPILRCSKLTASPLL